jgi:hypothetical protein
VNKFQTASKKKSAFRDSIVIVTTVLKILMCFETNFWSLFYSSNVHHRVSTVRNHVIGLKVNLYDLAREDPSNQFTGFSLFMSRPGMLNVLIWAACNEKRDLRLDRGSLEIDKQTAKP